MKAEVVCVPKSGWPYRVLIVGADDLRGRAVITAELFLALVLGTAALAGAEVFLRVDTVLGRFSRLPLVMVLRKIGWKQTLFTGLSLCNSIALQTINVCSLVM